MLEKTHSIFALLHFTFIVFNSPTPPPSQSYAHSRSHSLSIHFEASDQKKSHTLKLMTVYDR